MKSLIPLLFFCTSLMASSASPTHERLYHLPIQDLLSEVKEAHKEEKWGKLILSCKAMLQNFPYTPFAAESYFYLGEAHYKRKDYELANQAFTNYLKEEATPKYFEETLNYKFKIARRFEEGAKKHILGFSKLPKWLPAKEEALAIYDEIITTMPRHELAAQSLYRKARLLQSLNDYKPSIESFQTLIRRFPTHPLAPESYIGIAQVYKDECKSQFPNPDLLDLSEINLRKFKNHFPSESRIVVVEREIQEMKETLAKELFEIGDFYERTHKEKAAKIYYQTIQDRYPSTSYAQRSLKRLKALEQT